MIVKIGNKRYVRKVLEYAELYEKLCSDDSFFMQFVSGLRDVLAKILGEKESLIVRCVRISRLTQ